MLSSIVQLKEYWKLFFLLISILFVLILSSELYFLIVYKTDQLRVVLIYSVLVVLTPIIYLPLLGWLTNKVPLFGTWKNVVFHLFFCIIYVMLYLVTVQVLLMVFNGDSLAQIDLEYAYRALFRQFSFTGSSAFLVYWSIVVFYGVQSYFAQTVELTERNHAIESQLSKATLSTLKAQLKPHFLFNTLSLVDFLIHTSPKKAVETVSKLEDLLKSTFDTSQANTCTLETELAFINKYLDIEKGRFESRLEVDIQVSDNTRKTLIPCYLIQPLVENSIKHGVGKSLSTCTITIRSFIDQKQESMVIEVFDDGTGKASNKDDSDWGVGLKNVEERVKLFFGEEASISTSNETLLGFKTSVVIPTKYLTNDENSFS